VAAARTALATAPASGRGGNYERHRPEDTVLYQTLQAHWRTFVAEVSGGAESELPRFVIEEVEAFLKCGILANGFLRVVCDGCQENRLVAFSCKRRGFCSSCLGRRMCDFAAHLRDHVKEISPYETDSRRVGVRCDLRRRPFLGIPKAFRTRMNTRLRCSHKKMRIPHQGRANSGRENMRRRR
jgi:hypothetical protein